MVLVGAAILVTGCQVLSPPSREEVQRQALANLTLTEPWKAGGSSDAVQDQWLADFNDAQLNALNLKQAELHGDWNYAILPRRKK